MNELTRHDLSFAVRRIPRSLVELMRMKEFHKKVFIAGGFIRAVVANESVSDIDILCTNLETAVHFLNTLTKDKYLEQGKKFVIKEDSLHKGSVFIQYDRINGKKEHQKVETILEQKARGVYITENAVTLRGYSIPLQVITRWTFDVPRLCIDSFDFTIVQAAIYYDAGWKSIIGNRFYADLAAKRLVYTLPNREEEPGGSMLRVLKYYQRGYRIPLDSLSEIIVRVLNGIRGDVWRKRDKAELAFVICGLLREVDPAVDPLNEAHLPTINEDTDIESKLDF